MAKTENPASREQSMRRDELIEEVRRLRARLEETRDLPDIASDALRKARSRSEEYRAAFGVAADELARARAQLAEAWRELRTLEFSAPVTRPSLEAEGSGSGRGKSSDPQRTSGERGACPACGGFDSHSPGCSLARALDHLGDPRPMRRALEEAADRSWAERTGERDGVRSRLDFLDVLFEELEKWGVVRED